MSAVVIRLLVNDCAWVLRAVAGDAPRSGAQRGPADSGAAGRCARPAGETATNATGPRTADDRAP
jgi:hypothetical protein